MSRDVWLVTSGCYSDYMVVGVYSSRELAEEAKKLTASDSIEEFDLDSIPEHPPGKYLWRVVMFRDGAITYCGYADASAMWRMEEPRHNGSWDFKVWAGDSDQAVKAANERRAVLVAEGLWDRAGWEWTHEQPLYRGIELVKR